MLLPRLNHPNICTIYEIAEEGGRTFIAMEFLDGKTLKQLIQEGPLPIDRVIEIAIDITDALEAAHEKGIIHRDIKPANIFVTKRGNAKVLDFGLAKMLPVKELAAQERPGSTATHRRPGSRAGDGGLHVARAGAGQASRHAHRSLLFRHPALRDVYWPLAVPGDTTGELLIAIVQQVQITPAQLNPGVPEGLARIIDRCLEKDRELRYQHASEIRADLERVQRDPAAVVDRPSPFPQEEPPSEDFFGSPNMGPGCPWRAGLAAALAGAPSRAAGYCHRDHCLLPGKHPAQFQRFPTIPNSPTMARRSSWPARTGRGSIWAWNIRLHPESRRCRSRAATRCGCRLPPNTPSLLEYRPTAPNCSRSNARVWNCSILAVYGGCRRSMAHRAGSAVCWSPMQPGLPTALCWPIAIAATCFFPTATAAEHGSWLRSEDCITTPQFSPDGKRIRFTWQDLTIANRSLWEITVQGKHLHRLLPGWRTTIHRCKRKMDRGWEVFRL